jgi:phosphatidylinositol glycan class C protein
VLGKSCFGLNNPVCLLALAAGFIFRLRHADDLIDPDNYTDTETFLDHLQRNPRVRPYDFWPLVADSTVIVQHVCSVVIFVCCFVGIVQDRVSPVSIVCWGSAGTAVGWILWDNWIWKEHEETSQNADRVPGGDDGSSSTSFASAADTTANNLQSDDTKTSAIHGLGLTMSGNESKEQLIRRSADFSEGIDAITHSTEQQASLSVPSSSIMGNNDPSVSQYTHRTSMLSPRNRQRLTTVKSAFLIYFSLLGLSPILKSLTKSTASDSIWALSCWLLIMNIFSFDYGSGEGAGATTKFPASLSTNAAVMASTVLASRLPSTTHVFSLMLFSMEVFGLFPIFRRQLRQKSWTGHVVLTLILVTVAGGAVGVTLSGGWAAAIIGSVLGSILTALVMGGCSWWLISLQKYKNVVIGPWDPARPIIRRHWN